MIHNILFDFGNVLTDIDIPATESALGNIPGLDPEKLKVLAEKHQWFERYECGDMEEESFINALQRCYKPVPEGFMVTRAINAMLIGIPPSRFPLMAALKKEYRTFILSNTNQTHLRWVHRHLNSTHDISDFESRYFEKVYYSHLIGLRKPSPEAFNFILQDASIKPEETLFIDDVIENTLVAAKLGFKVYHHDPEKEIFDVLGDVIKSFGK